MDNNSTDRTKETVESFIRTSALPLRLVFESNQGLSHARNTGVGKAAGEIVAFTDDDVTVDRFWLSQLKETFDRFDCIGVGGKIIPVWTCDKPSWFTEDGPHRLLSFIISFDLGDDLCEIRTSPFGANMAFRRVAFQKYGLFRTDLGRAGKKLLHGEDSEFGRRLLDGGERLIYAPRAVVHHPVESYRTRKKYCQSWYFMYGRTSVRLASIRESAVCYFGVPRYLFRQFFESMSKWFFATDSQLRFYNKLEVCRIAGEIAETFSASKNSRQG